MPRPFAVIGLSIFFVLAFLFDCSTETAVTVFIIFTAALSVALCVRVLRQGKVLPAVFASGAVACLILVFFNTYIYEPVIMLDGKQCEATLRITDEPEQNYGNWYYPAKVVSLGGEETNFKIRLVLSEPAEAESFDYISGNFNLYKLGSSSEEILNSYKASGTYLGAYPLQNEYRVIKSEGAEPFSVKILRLRSAIKQAVYRILPNEYGALAVALLLGDRSGISPYTLMCFRKIGVSHVICVSGLHLSVWGLLILNILRKTKIGERLSNVITAVFVVLFMQVTGMSYSVIRSGIMMLVFLLSNILMRRRDALNSLGFALAVMSVADPYSAGSVGLQLSALSSLGIILCSENILPAVREKLGRVKNIHLRSAALKICESVLVTAAAVSFTLPVSAKLNSGFTFAVFPANMLIVWAAGYAMVLCALGGLIGAITLNIFNLPGFLGGMLCKYMIKTAQLTAHFDFLFVRVSYEKMLIIIIGVLLLAGVSVFAAYNGKAMKGLTAGLCSAVFIISLFVSSYFEKTETRITAVDVGSGTSVLVSRGKDNLLIGCSGSDRLHLNKIQNAVSDTGYELKAVVSVEKGDDTEALSLNADKIYGAADNAFTEMFTDEKISVGGISFAACETEKGIAVKACADGVSVLVCSSPYIDISELPEEFQTADFLVSRGDLPQNYENISPDYTVINAEALRGGLIETELCRRGISCASTAEKGNVTLRCRNGYFCAERS